MATISSARQKELIAFYENMKVLLLEVEGKYSLDSRKITIDFPPTLGLSKLTYTKHTAAELLEIARQQTAAKYSEKNRVLTNSYATNLRSIEQSKQTLLANYVKKLAELDEALSKAMSEVEHKLADNGMWYSTIRGYAVTDVGGDYANKTKNLTNEYESKNAAYIEREQSLKIAYENAQAQLLVQQEEEIAALVVTLGQKEDREARAVEKFNTSVDEKEAKYQASCVRYQMYAQQAEDNRAIAMLKLYAQLGATGFEARKMSDLYATCRSELSSLTKGEAQFIFGLDSFLRVHLGIYYDSLVEWANVTLRAD